MSESNGKKPDGNSGAKAGEISPLVPQPHGGALYQGAAPPELRVAGTGRPRSELRRKMRGTLEERFGVLESILAAGKDSDRVAALNLLAKYGLGEQARYDPELVQELWHSVEALIPEEQRKSVQEAWVRILSEYMAK